VTNYTIQNNIGIPHIFRCPKCDILLKINQDEIVSPYEDSAESVEEYLGYEEKAMSLVEHASKNEPERFEMENSLQVPKEKLQTIRIGGFFGKTYTIKKEGEKLVYQKVSIPNNATRNNTLDRVKYTNNKEPKLKKVEVPQYWKPLGREANADNNGKRPSFINCPGCGTQIRDKDLSKRSCPYCGHKLDL
jgi:ssDNA-binding Zn-finger/Zn-ribbon topoisomerase 1